MKPYIGVTGATTIAEIDQAMDCFDEAGVTQDDTYRPMIGILVSYKTLNDIPTDNRRYPKFSMVPALVAHAEQRGAFSMIHYNSREERLDCQLNEIVSKIETTGCRAFQINIAWPNRQDIETFHDVNGQQYDIVLQVNKHMMETDPLYLAEYRGLVQGALIDPSGGQGKSFDIPQSMAFYEALRDMGVVVGIAGGLHGMNVESRVRALMDAGVKDFSIDAEGRLRNKISDEYGDDVWNPKKVYAYILNAAHALL